MSSTLDRYLLREIMGPFLSSLLLFFGILSFAQMLKVSDALTGLGLGFGELLEALLYSFPAMLGVLIPISLLFATLIAVGRFASDRELLAVANAGGHPYRLLRAPLLLSCLCAALSAGALIEGEPWGVRSLRSLMSRGAQRTLAEGVRPGQFSTWVDGVTFYASSKKGDELQGVFFADLREPKKPIVLSAKSGKLQGGIATKDLVFSLFDGQLVSNPEAQGRVRRTRFEQARYLLDVQRFTSNKLRTTTPLQEMNLVDLWFSRERFPPRKAAMMTVLFHRKLALPVSTILFALMAIPLGVSRNSASRARAFLYAAGIVSLYYYLGRFAEIQARAGDLNPHLAAWVPTIVAMGGLGALLWRYGRRPL